MSNDPSDFPTIVRDFVEAFAFFPEKIHPATKLSWAGAYALQPHAARINYTNRIQDEGLLKGVAKKIPALLLMGEEDMFLLPDRLEKLFRETFGDDVEVQVWPETGHILFFEEPERTRDAILGFVKRVNKVRLSFRVSLV
jgi:pimeloyl-ACP methyl ester carboxylesterase